MEVRVNNFWFKSTRGIRSAITSVTFGQCLCYQLLLSLVQGERQRMQMRRAWASLCHLLPCMPTSACMTGIGECDVNDVRHGTDARHETDVRHGTGECGANGATHEIIVGDGATLHSEHCAGLNAR
jgi:hypothetical protein